MRPPSSRTNIPPFLAMEMAREADRLAQSGQFVARFDVGQPHWGAPEAARAALKERLDRAVLGYTGGLGLPALRVKLAAHYAANYGLAIAPDRFIITTGASGAFTLAFLALFEAGERVAMAAPGYPPYRHILTALGYAAISIDAQAQNKYQLTGEEIAGAARNSKLAGVLVASPANPTGAMLDEAALAQVAAAARAAGAALISDEIYHGLTYARPAASMLGADPDALVINSFSKYWAMTGWRVGWIVAPEHLVKPIERLAQNLTIGPPTPSQVAALGALDAGEECEARRGVYAQNRALLLDALPKLGLAPIAPPDGAFYMLLDVSAHADDSGDFCRRALAEAGVALTTGQDFDERRGRAWVRLAYARSAEEVAEGAARLGRWLGG
jgi:aspartate/methionine/tyrosine aminotransferase